MCCIISYNWKWIVDQFHMLYGKTEQILDMSEQRNERVNKLTNLQTSILLVILQTSANWVKALCTMRIWDMFSPYHPPAQKKLPFKDLTLSIIATQCKQAKYSSGGKQSACRLCLQILLKLGSIFQKIPAGKQQHENSRQLRSFKGPCNFERIFKYHS